MRENGKQRKKAFALFFFALLTLLFGAGMRAGRAEGGNALLAAELETEKETFFVLTQEEEDYLANLRGQLLFAGVSAAGLWELKDGVDCGVAAPLADVLHYEFGLDVKLVQGNWEENRAAMQDKAIDLLIGVPAVDSGKDAAEEMEDLPETALHCSAWLYEKPYVLVEDTGAGNEKNAGEGSKKATLAYINADPSCETLLPRIFETPGLYLQGADSANDIGLFPCADEDAVFDALKNGQADAGLVSEDALFRHYPFTHYSVIAQFSAYNSKMSVAAADERLLPLLEILNRYLDTTQEGDALRTAISTEQQHMRQGNLHAQEAKILKNLQERGENLQYALMGLDNVPYFWHDKNITYGELADFLTFLSDYTGIALKESFISGEEALQALEDGELLFVAGMPFTGNGQAYRFAGIYGDFLIPVMPREDMEQFYQGKNTSVTKEADRTAELAASRYWGVVQDFMPLLAGTAFDGHAVGFADEGMLYEAMRAGEIGGMLLPEGSFDALLLSEGNRGGTVRAIFDALFSLGKNGKKNTYERINEISIPIRSGMAFREADADVAEFFARMWQFFRGTCEEPKAAKEQYRAAYVQMQKVQEGMVLLVWVFGAAMVVFLAAFLLGRRRKGKG